MNTSKHTPGPWVFGDPSAKVPNRFVRDNQGDVVAYASANDIRQAQQDAHLIAAAPAMYEALKLCKAFIDHGPSVTRSAARCKEVYDNALAQAEGRQA